MERIKVCKSDCVRREFTADTWSRKGGRVEGTVEGTVVKKAEGILSTLATASIVGSIGGLYSAAMQPKPTLALAVSAPVSHRVGFKTLGGTLCRL